MDRFIILVGIDTHLKLIAFIIYNSFVYIFIADMQKFPLRMKDNDLLVTELYRDPSNDHITAISVYLTPKTTSKSQLFQSFCIFLCLVVGIYNFILQIDLLFVMKIL